MSMNAGPPTGTTHATSRVGWKMTALLCLVYIAYLVAVMVWPAAMSVNIGGNLTPGLALGAGVVLWGLALCFYYVSKANALDAEQGRRP